MEGGGEGGGGGEGECDGLGAEEYTNWVEEGLEEEVREGEDDEGVGGGGERRVLFGDEKQGTDREPEERDGERGEEEEEDGSAEGVGEEVGTTSAVGLSADGVHSGGETGEDGVACDVGEAHGQRAAGERERAEAAEEEHGDHGSRVKQKRRKDKGEGKRKKGFCFGERGRGKVSLELGVEEGGLIAARSGGVDEESGEGEGQLAWRRRVVV
ncbi:hypothetical protein M5K25_027050 [Dendrobium thyrsiflorum]|uniref:Uncharacterized protein n=1 Tax=Dendrobium thyrsiflorum TaxID=117978 RepID=A0ABD0TZ04_DENTH